MKKITSMILAMLLTVSFSGCEVIRPAQTKAVVRTTAANPKETKLTDAATPGDSTGAANTTNSTNTMIESATTTPVTTSIETQTTPVATEPQSQDEVKSNLPAKLRKELDKVDNGIMLIYYPEKFPEIKAITRWTIIDYNTNTQVFLVTKKKGSIVEVSKAELTNDDRVVIPGEVIRDWETTSDYEVIRILYTDPETIPFNFIKVKEPGGKVTTTHLRTSMRDNPDWEVYPYDK
ncbi:MAG: hypothetical protein WAV55_05340 [Clostridiaceae bacterium]